MLGHAIERGISGLIARWMLQGKAEAVFASVARSGALPAEEVERLREETLTHLKEVEREGAPYADMVLSAARDLLPELSTLVSQARTSASAAAAEALRSAAAAVDPGVPPSRSNPEPPKAKAEQAETTQAGTPQKETSEDEPLDAGQGGDA